MPILCLLAAFLALITTIKAGFDFDHDRYFKGRIIGHHAARIATAATIGIVWMYRSEYPLGWVLSTSGILLLSWSGIHQLHCRLRDYSLSWQQERNRHA